MTGKRKGIGLFGDCQSTNLRTVNHYFPQIARRTINIAVVDHAGILVGFIRQPGAPLHSIDIAIDKAYTAASFGLATGKWPDALQAHSPAVQDGLLRRPRFVAFGGGLPIEIDGQRLGGIGVSGGSEAQDELIAGAGLAALASND
ncbi:MULTISPECIES: GlcG/HbpS family heme-binding protein [Sphingomonadaceae]|uniref:Heme-binding protein n=1 Tax=Sphingobium yanoikuyae TaxID=13690 RepID=A0A6M4GFX1_SPHYA|nr:MULTISPECIES: heme-binding protein [Sphingomonadaceae]QJR06149.1 heme-binding protein [Sphingobium yanoikuyae]QXF14302.1 heme-binding protein [Sphingopyxis terrae subsp. terrae]WDA39528.1 heme-binding protein [Sphingobium sp. YC-XJ3]